EKSASWAQGKRRASHPCRKRTALRLHSGRAKGGHRPPGEDRRPAAAEPFAAATGLFHLAEIDEPLGTLPNEPIDRGLVEPNTFVVARSGVPKHITIEVIGDAAAQPFEGLFEVGHVAVGDPGGDECIVVSS